VSAKRNIFVSIFASVTGRVKNAMFNYEGEKVKSVYRETVRVHETRVLKWRYENIEPDIDASERISSIASSAFIDRVI